MTNDQVWDGTAYRVSKIVLDFRVHNSRTIGVQHPNAEHCGLNYRKNAVLTDFWQLAKGLNFSHTLSIQNKGLTVKTCQ